MTRPGGKGPYFGEQLVEAEPRQVLHHVVKRAVVGVAVVVDFNRVRMGQTGGCLHLPFEPGQRRRIGSRVGANQLQGTWSLQQNMLGQEHVSHASAAKFAHQLILAVSLGLTVLDAGARQQPSTRRTACCGCLLALPACF